QVSLIDSVDRFSPPSTGFPPLSVTMQHDEMRTSLQLVTKEAHGMWEENKDLQGRFVNDLGELHRIQLAIQQLESDQRHDQLGQARQSLAEMQRRASSLYDCLQEKRSHLVKKLGDGLQHVALLQNNLISERLLEWKNRQKLFQIGIPFDNREQSLDDLQCDFELLAEHNWQMRTFASWQIDLLRRGPQLTDNNAQSHINNLSTILDQLTKLLCMLVSQSFIVSVQPEPVLKTQHKFVTEARLLIGDKLGIRQHLVHTNVTVRIIAEEEARLLSVGQMGYPEVKTVGTISNEYEKINMDERGHMVCKFNNSKLTRIAHRKPPPKGSLDMKVMGVASPGPAMLMTSQAATDQKYALLYNISSFQLGNLGKFDVWTLSLPLMVTVHGSQDCDAQGAILWQRAFANVNRCGTGNEMVLASWPDLAQVIRHKFSLFTGAKRPLSDTDLSYLYEKLYAPGSQEGKPITFHQFAKQDLRDDVGFTFWEWLFSCMQLIKQKLLKFWDEGWLIGFISKHDASSQLMQMPHSSFLLRFSDTQTGAVSICFALEDDNKKIPFHLAPFTIKDLDQLSLAQRIITCPQLKEIRFLYPSIDKEEMLKYFESEERQKAEQESTTGYIMSEIVMVAKTANKTQRGTSFAADSPSPLSNQSSKLDWSPGEVLPAGANNNSMDVGDELVSMLNNSGLMENGDVEALLGPGFRPQLPQQPLQQIDLSFVDQFGQPVMGMQGMQQQFYNGHQ
ncbi:hypothetical protein PMAYCL1PPCAC_16438, partial [Pristionchus mayeri]